jgi:hypothetical protein
MMASAKIEQAMRGQMGQPAACMMLSKIELSNKFQLRDSVLIMADGIVLVFCG